MAAPEQPEEVAILDVARDLPTRINFVSHQRQKVIQALAQQSKKARGVPDITSDPSKSLNERLLLFLRWLDMDVQISPELTTKTKIDQGLKLIFDTPAFQFPQNVAEKARSLYAKWEDENWGADEVADEEEEEEDSSDNDLQNGVKHEDSSEDEQPKAKKRKVSTTSTTAADDSDLPVARLRLPPSTHPIYGAQGIMHGIANKASSKRRVYVLNPTLQARNAKVYGHNGLQVGAWFPLQILALFNGAHGSAMGGIAGNQSTGAYSVVVSGKYEDLDEDKGDVVYYSGSNSHSNTDPREPPPSTPNTLALQASIATGKPVRVLRSALGKSRYRPSCGLRYDGLYRVVSTRQPINMKGGKYEQFRLERLEGQEALDTVWKRSPSKAEKRAYEKIGFGY